MDLDIANSPWRTYSDGVLGLSNIFGGRRYPFTYFNADENVAIHLRMDVPRAQIVDAVVIRRTWLRSAP